MEIREVLKSQYLAALEMMRQAVERCPESLWDDPQDHNRFWHVAFHTLFYTHLHLQADGAPGGARRDRGPVAGPRGQGRVSAGPGARAGPAEGKDPERRSRRAPFRQFANLFRLSYNSDGRRPR